MRRTLGLLSDYLILPLFFAAVSVGTYAALRTSLPPWALPFVVLPPAVVLIVILERLRPERPEYLPMDQPVGHEVGHFLLGLEAGAVIGNGIAILAAFGLAWLLKIRPEHSLWPNRWPLAAQVGLSLVLGEPLSYWQHRFCHRLGWLWPFHALHHTGERLNFARAGRFHIVDVVTGVFMTYLPILALGASPVVFAWYAVLASAMGLVQHADIRMRTPVWLDYLICTPAVHRFHHSKAFRESDGNFGTTVMIFDLIFRTYVRPTGGAPLEVGLEDDRVPKKFWHQVFLPFRRPSPQETLQ